MPECIVCKGYREAGKHCQRCHYDNVAWDRWQATHVEEKEGLDGLLAFCAPHFYLPFLMTALALPFGLMGMAGLWRGILPAAQLVAVVVVVCLCLLGAFAAYDARHEIREQQLLTRVRRGRVAFLRSPRFRSIVVPAFLLFLVLLIVVTLINSDLAWTLAEWFLLDPEYLTDVKQLERLEREAAADDTLPENDQSEEDHLRERLRQVFPVAMMGMYVAFMPSFT